MRKLWTRTLGLVAAAGLTGCVTAPTTSYVPVMPAPYKPFSVFAQDQQACRAWASQQVAGQAEQANNNAVAGGLIGAALGAGLGAAASDGRGGATAFGAATGAIVGSSIGANSNQAAAGGIQRQYDIAYEQCMYARGNQVPGMQAPYSPGPPPPPPSGHYAAPPDYSGPAYPQSSYPPPNQPPPSSAPTTLYPRPTNTAPTQ